MEGHDRQRYKAWHRMMMMIVPICPWEWTKIVDWTGG